MLQGYVKSLKKNINNQLQKVNIKFPKASIIILEFYRDDIIFSLQTYTYVVKYLVLTHSVSSATDLGIHVTIYSPAL